MQIWYYAAWTVEKRQLLVFTTRTWPLIVIYELLLSLIWKELLGMSYKHQWSHAGSVFPCRNTCPLPLLVLLPPHLRAQYVNNRPVNETGWSYKVSCSNSVREYKQRQSRMIGWQSDCSSGAAFCSHTTDMVTELCGKIQSLMNIYENFFIKSNYMCNYMMNNSGWATYCDGTLISHVELLMPGSNILWSTYTKPECIWNPMSSLLCDVGGPTWKSRRAWFTGLRL